MARRDEQKAGDQPQARGSRSLLERPARPKRQGLKQLKKTYQCAINLKEAMDISPKDVSYDQIELLTRKKVLNQKNNHQA